MESEIRNLGYAPNVNDIDDFLQKLKFRRHVMGKSIQKRDLLCYEFYSSGEHVHGQEIISLPKASSAVNDTDISTVLLLSLVHGNEPMGLLSLLTTLAIWTDESRRQVSMTTSGLLRSQQRQQPFRKPFRIIAFPVVNVDAYTRNIFVGSGSRRTNLRDFNDCCGKSDTDDCPRGGVDLNRNYPFKDGGLRLSDTNDADFCGYNYPGTKYFSEPETSAVRDIVSQYNVTAALSFHSLSDVNRGQPLLIHPYADESRSLDILSLIKYKRWGRQLNSQGQYKYGLAKDVIGYSAQGVSIDWLQSKGITSLVLEAVPPCEDRWCFQNEVFERAHIYGLTGVNFINLAIGGNRVIVSNRWSMSRSVLFVTALLISTFLFLKRRKIASWHTSKRQE